MQGNFDAVCELLCAFCIQPTLTASKCQQAEYVYKALELCMQRTHDGVSEEENQ